MMYEIIVGIVCLFIGFMIQRIMCARIGHLWTEGKSWETFDNRLYQLIHRFYCELCPTRLYCKKYKKRFKHAA